MKIHCQYSELVNVSALKEHPKNSNKHPTDQIERLARILEYQGWRYPVKVSRQTGYVTSGHGRILAAKLNGWREVPVSFQDYEDETQEWADVTSDNAIASWAELDLSTINAFVPDLGPDFDLDLLGIKDFTLDAADKYQGDEDAVPETPLEPKVKRGELWILGEHRLLIDDCTVKENVERLMGGEKAELFFTSPPYSDQRDYSGSLDLSIEKLAGCLQAHASLYVVNLGYQRKEKQVFRYWDEWIKEAEKRDLKLLSWNIWDRGSPFSIGQQTAMFPIEHEWIFVFGFETKDLNRTIENKWGGLGRTGVTNREKDGTLKRRDPVLVQSHRPLGTVCRVGVDREQGIDHPAKFPVALPEEYIKACTSDGDGVIEPFCGSGSTLIACEKTNRKCFGMEIDPHYGAVIIERWQKFTGREAVREDGTKYSDL